MIIIKTPFRVSFGGGGSDIEEFYGLRGGAVISTTINRYMYIMIHPYFHNKIRIKYAKTEDVNAADHVKHPLVKECLKLMRIGNGVEIASIADVPAKTGLGSSSAFTVGLLNALSEFNGKRRSKKWLAEKACDIEINKVGEPIGKQDQYAVSFGGFNHIKFNANGSVSVRPISIKPAVKNRLESNLMMFYIGNERKAGDILKDQKKGMKKRNNIDALSRMVGICGRMKVSLKKGSIDEFGDLLHEGWMLKKKLAKGITKPTLDIIYDKALKNGARGGKILGAGGGGFMLFYCDRRKQNKLRKALSLRELKFGFDEEGTKVVYSDKNRVH